MKTTGSLLRHDLPAGVVVFLVALPLCLGIALASGAPLFGGIIAGIIGGLVIGALSGSSLSVSGPAAGLAVIVATAIRDLGSYPVFLLAVVLAGAMQFLFGVIKLGVIADYVPNSVIKGLLAAIGVVIVLKQIPHALGRDADFEGDFSFLRAGHNDTLKDIAESIASATPGAVLISVLSIAVLLLWERYSSKGYMLFKALPGPLVLVALGIGINQLFGWSIPSLKLVDPEHMVSLPVASTIAEFFRQFSTPDFTAVANRSVWIAAGTIALVASLETLLSLEASDRLDPLKRISPPNRELMAQGVGNILSGLIGGLPITSVVVRTSANVYAGGRTRASTIFHGLLLLIAVLLIPTVLNLTPLACLAAVLIVVGYKLTKPALYRTMYSLGWDQFLPFIITVLAVVFTDLLTGVLIGLVCGAFFVIRTNHHEAITVVEQDGDYLLRFNKDASFVNKSEFRQKLRRLPPGARILIDGTRALFIDHDILEVAEDFKQLAPHKEIEVELKHFESARR